jgi:glycosyltransferase involved in cell wall biosynthesis
MQLRWKLGKRVKIIILHRAEKPFKGLKKYLQKLADSCVDAYLFTSAEFGKEWIKNGIMKDEKKIHEVIQASSEFMYGSRSEARSTLNITGSRIYLWVGRLDANKDPLTVVKAFIGFLAVEPDASLYIIYQKKDLLPEIMKLVDTEPIAKNRIKFIGNIAHDDLQDWYNSADFIISGSHYEGSGIAVSEAMSCGCIPLVTNIPSFRKMTGPGRCGILYEPGNTSALLFCLKKTLELNIGEERDKVLLQFQQELSFDAIANKINKIIGDTG